MNAMGEQGTHFWFMTIYKVTGGDGSVRDFRGTFCPPSGATRFDVFDLIKQKVHQSDPSTVGGTAIAFDVQRNTL